MLRPSLTSRILLWLLRLFLRRRIKPDMDVVAERKHLIMLGRFSERIPPNLALEELNFQGGENFRINTLSHQGTASQRVLLYLHGGGFIWEMPQTYLGFVGAMCKLTKADAWVPWYRLAPEFPYPTGPEDCFATYRALLEKYAPDDIVMMGDSAGGNLVLTTLLRAREASLPMPRCAVLLSPVTDLAEQSSTWVLNGWTGKDPLFPANAFTLLDHYCGNHDRRDPLMSPYYGNFEGLPPMLFLAGETESLLDDSVAVAKRAGADGVRTSVQIWRGMPHVFPLLGILPEAKLARATIANFVNTEFKGMADQNPGPLITRV